MRYVVSDIHGNYDLLIKYLKKVNFNNNDKLYVLGDMLDKGKDVEKLIALLFEKLENNCIIIAGNHEYELSKYIRALIDRNVDDDVLLKNVQTYLQIGNPLSFENIEKVLNLPFYIEEDDFIMVHAGVSFDLNGDMKPLNEALVEELVYNRDFKDPNCLIDMGKCVLFGHTPTQYVSGSPDIFMYKKPNRLGDNIKDYYKIHLDTGNYLTGVLGGICIDTLSVEYVKKNRL